MSGTMNPMTLPPWALQGASASPLSGPAAPQGPAMGQPNWSALYGGPAMSPAQSLSMQSPIYRGLLAQAAAQNQPQQAVPGAVDPLARVWSGGHESEANAAEQNAQGTDSSSAGFG